MANCDFCGEIEIKFPIRNIIREEAVKDSI